MGIACRPDDAEVPRSIARNPTVRAFRRALLAFLAAAVFAAVVRLRGRGGVPPQGGGWRELSSTELS